MSSERTLRLLLRLGAACTLPAFLALAMPQSWMAATHRSLGLGELPATPVVEYLARSIAALYGFHGVLMLVVSFDVRRYAGIVSYLAAMNAGFGALVLVIDLEAGLPLWWTLVEGPSVVAFGVVLFVLRRSIEPPGIAPPQLS